MRLESMILIFSFSSALAISIDAEKPKNAWNALYASTFANGKLSYTGLPWTKNEARQYSWTEVAENTRKDNLRYFCPKDDKTVCVIFGSEGDIVGVQLAMSATDQKVIKLGVGGTPFVKKKMEGETYWKVDVYFFDPAHMKQSSMLTTSNVNRESGVGSLMNRRNYLGSSMHVEKDGVASFPISADNPTYLSKVMQFDKQGCVANRGTNYAYGFSLRPYLCDRIYPIAPIYQNEKLVGFNFLVAGTYSSKWFQVLDEAAIKTMYPSAPECFMQYARQHKFSNIHFRFTENMSKLC